MIADVADSAHPFTDVASAPAALHPHDHPNFSVAPSQIFHQNILTIPSHRKTRDIRPKSTPTPTTFSPRETLVTEALIQSDPPSFSCVFFSLWIGFS